jgi:hypothetical protein
VLSFAEVAERLRRLTRNQLGSSRAGSNPALREKFLPLGAWEETSQADGDSRPLFFACKNRCRSSAQKSNKVRCPPAVPTVVCSEGLRRGGMAIAFWPRWLLPVALLYPECSSLITQICDEQHVRLILSCALDHTTTRADECGAIANSYGLVVREPNVTDERLFESLLTPSAQCVLPSDLRADFTRVSRFLRSMAQNVGRPHAEKSGHETQALVVVVGAGPVGLISAVQAHASGARVLVIEKRRNYTRDIWFDLLPPKFDGLAVPLLEAWGFFALELPYVREVQQGTGIVTVQCHVLQSFLTLVTACLTCGCNGWPHPQL